MMNLKTKQMVTLKKFSAVWCGPCRALAPVINEVKNQFSNVKFEEYDVDTAYDEATKYGIRSVPTVMFFDGNVKINSTVGMQSDNHYKEILAQIKLLRKDLKK